MLHHDCQPSASFHHARVAVASNAMQFNLRDLYETTRSGEGVETRHEAEMDVVCAGPSRARTARDERQGWLFCVSGADNIHPRRDPTPTTLRPKLQRPRS